MLQSATGADWAHWPREPRDALVGVVATLPDAVLRQPMPWGGNDQAVGEVLLGLSAHRALRLQLQDTLAGLGWDAPAAIHHLQWAPIARARLEAALVGVPDALLDTQPFAGEWRLRQQLAHVELTDIRYTIATQYAIRRRDTDPLLPPEEAYPPRQAEPDGTPGESLAAIVARLRRVRATALTPLLGISATQLLRPTEWHAAEHTVGFRLHRFAQHDLELASDIRHTLAALGNRPTRGMRIASVLVEAWGELEATLLGVPAAIYDRRPSAEDLTITEQLRLLGDADAQLLERLRAVAP
jgi:hypothetical protein